MFISCGLQLTIINVILFQAARNSNGSRKKEKRMHWKKLEKHIISIESNESGCDEYGRIIFSSKKRYFMRNLFYELFLLWKHWYDNISGNLFKMYSQSAEFYNLWCGPMPNYIHRIFLSFRHLILYASFIVCKWRA